MHEQGLQLINRQKLHNGRCRTTAFRECGVDPATGKVRRLRRDRTKHEWVIEGISLAGGRKPLQLHTECFHLWERERHTLAGETKSPIRAADDGPDGR